MYLRATGRRFTKMNAYFLVMNSKRCNKIKWFMTHIFRLDLIIIIKSPRTSRRIRPSWLDTVPVISTALLPTFNPVRGAWRVVLLHAHACSVIQQPNLTWPMYNSSTLMCACQRLRIAFSANSKRDNRVFLKKKNIDEN